MSETKMSDHLGSSLKIWQDALRIVRTRQGLDDEERERWVELYEHEIARVEDKGVTREECGKIRARLEAWIILRRALPTRTPRPSR